MTDAYSKGADAERANDAGDPAASDLRHDANRALDIGRVALGIGVLSGGAGAALFLTAPQSKAQVAISTAGLDLSMRASW